MKRIGLTFFFFFLLVQWSVFATEPFRFALFTDLHISESKPQHAEDLKLAVTEVNANPLIEFVLVSGDDSDLGDLNSLISAKQMLDELKVPYYITSGNHDTNQGKIGSANFIQVFKKDTFSITRHGFRFVGFPTGPEKDESIGHIKAADFDFVKRELDKNNPTFVVTHYPLLKGDIDNFQEMWNLLEKHTVIAVLNGHYHRNALFSYAGVPGIVNRSTQRGNQKKGGYTIYSVSDTLKVAEKIIGEPEHEWMVLPLHN